MNEQNFNNGMNGGPGMPPPPPQGYMNMNGGPGMPPPPPQGYMNMNARPPQRRNPAVSPNRFRDVWYSGTGICDHMCGMSVQQLVEYIVGCAFDSINSVYQYMHGTI